MHKEKAMSKVCDTLNEALVKSLILLNPDPYKLHVLFTDSSKYMWPTVLSQVHTTSTDSKVVSHEHLITYVTGFSG